MSKSKYLLLLIFFFFSTNHFCVADDAVINIQHVPNHGTHSGQPLFPADQPDVYYNDVTQVIIVDGTGYSTYYNVEITSLSTFYVMISTSVNGNYDTIDVSSLPDDNYEIVLTSSYNNVFEGYFTNY